MVKVASNQTHAQDAASGLSNTASIPKASVTITESNITAMTTGATVAEQMVDNVTNFAEAVKVQADKFPQLASVMAARDQSTTFDVTG